MTPSATGSSGALLPAAGTLTGWPARPSLARNVVLNWTAIAVTILSTLVVTPIIVRTLQKELYGIWSFLNGLLTYADVLYLGLGAALVKYAAVHLARRDAQRLNRLCSVVLTIYAVIGVVSLLACTLLARHVPALLAHGLDARHASAATYTCVLLGFRLLSLFVCSVFTGSLIAADRTDVARVVTIAFTLLRLVLVPIAVRAPSPLVGLALLVATTAAGEALATAWLALRVIPGLRPRFVLPRTPELHVLYGFGLQSFLVLMAVKLVSYTDQTVIGLTLGPASVALYALPLQLVEYGRVLVNGLVAVLLPRLTVLQMERNTAGLRDAYLRACRVTGAFAALMNVQLIMLGPPFLERWVGRDFGQPARFILVCLGVASILQAVSTQVSLPFSQATGRLRVPAAVLFGEGLANLALTLALIPALGLDGVALGTLLPSLAISFLALPAYQCHTLGVPLRRLAVEGLLPAGLTAVLGLAVLAALGAADGRASYGAIALKAAVTTVVVAAGLLGACARERRELFALVGRFRRPAPRPALSVEE